MHFLARESERPGNRARGALAVARRSATRPARAHSAVHLWDDGVANSLQGISMCVKLRGRRPGCTPQCGVARAAISTGCLGDVATTRLAPINPPFLRRARSNVFHVQHLSFLLRMTPTEAFPVPQMVPLAPLRQLTSHRSELSEDGHILRVVDLYRPALLH